MTALLTDSVQDVAVIDTALRLAVPLRAPLLLVAVLPHARPSVTAEADACAARAVVGRVRRAGLDHIPVVHRVTPRGTRLRAAGAVLDVAARHLSSVLVAAARGPAGLDAHLLAEASALRCGPFVHTAAPTAWTPSATQQYRPGAKDRPTALTGEA
ncbi:universal stress protein [Streptomyces albogriseolus]